MKKFYIIASFAVSALAFSQTTLTKANNDYLAGNSINSKNMLGTPDNSAVGSGVTFNNAALTDGTFVTAQVTAPSATELVTFPGTTVKFDDGNGNLIYYKSTATQLEITGATVSGAVLNFAADNALFLKFPTAYGDTYSDTARGSFSNGVVSGLFKGTINSSADASGTLLLGSQTFNNVLRVKTVQNYNLYQSTDTNYVMPIGTLVSTFFTYYDDMHRYPLFTSTTATISVPLLGINQTSTAAVAQNISSLATVDASAKKVITAYPNPVQDHLFFAGDLSGYDRAEVYGMDGKLVSSVKIQSGSVDLKNLPEGNYMVKVSGKNGKGQSVQIIKK